MVEACLTTQAFRQAPSAPLTGGIASGSSDIGPNSLGMWPTPTAQDAKNDAGPSQWDRNSDPLNVAVKRWPTPSSGGESGGPHGLVGGSGHREMLLKLVGEEEARGMAGGSLNPTWVEWLMGFPLGWTDCEHLATPSFRKSLKRSDAGS